MIATIFIDGDKRFKIENTSTVNGLSLPTEPNDFMNYVQHLIKEQHSLLIETSTRKWLIPTSKISYIMFSSNNQ
jgi:hypothetical protein